MENLTEYMRAGTHFDFNCQLPPKLSKPKQKVALKINTMPNKQPLYDATNLYDYKDPSEILVSNTSEETQRSSHKAHQMSLQIMSQSSDCYTNSPHSQREGIAPKNTLKLNEPIYTPNSQRSMRYMAPTLASDYCSKKPLSAKAQAAKARVQENKEKFTYQPRINCNIELSETKNQRLERLFMPKTTQLQRRERQKAIEENDKIKQYCTFRPNISPCDSHKHSSLVSQRLHHEADERIPMREQMLRSKITDSLKECTFQPKITANNKINQPPIYQRFLEIQKNHYEKMKMLKEQTISQNNSMFKPTINHKSSIIMEEKQMIDGESLSVTERMVKDVNNRMKKELQNTDNQNASTRKSSNSSRASPCMLYNRKEFENRQNAHIHKQREKMEKSIGKINNECTFKPQINFTSEILIESNPMRAEETSVEKYERLSYKDCMKKELKQKAVKEAEMKSYTFRPTIDSISNTLGRQITVQEMSNDQIRQQKLNALACKYKDEEMRECSFKPKMTTNPDMYSINSHYSARNNILAEARKIYVDRLQQLEQIERDAEYHELKQCTFRPDINASRPKPTTASIHGIERTLELKKLKELQERQKHEQQERVFGYGKGPSKIGSTVPRPFSFETEKRSHSKSWRGK